MQPYVQNHVTLLNNVAILQGGWSQTVEKSLLLPYEMKINKWKRLPTYERAFNMQLCAAQAAIYIKNTADKC